MSLSLRLSRTDSVDLYRKAASQRFRDAAVLANHGRRLAAIYLFGYCVEMILKAAFFRLRGIPSSRPITKHDLSTVRETARAWGLGSADGHDLRWGTDLVIAARREAGRPLPVQEASSLKRSVDAVVRNWQVSLRYRVNQPFERELWEVRAAAHWILSYYRRLY